MNVIVEIERREPEPPKPEWECPVCGAGATLLAVRNNLMVCPSCDAHQRIGSRERIRQLADGGVVEVLFDGITAVDELDFVDLETYPERLRNAQTKTGLSEALVCGRASIEGAPCLLAVIDFGFMGGSMGSVLGERFWRCAELAALESLPLVAVCSSGGARMQEGILSLMQMAKTTCAVDLMNEAGAPFITVLVDPCTGGVLASFATLADICIAEPGALLSFSGPRVIAETTREALPDDFGSAERTLALGHVDAVVPRHELRPRISNYLKLLGGGEEIGRRQSQRSSKRGPGRLAQAALGRARSVAAHARHPLVRRDRQAPGADQGPAARQAEEEHLEDR